MLFGHNWVWPGEIQLRVAYRFKVHGSRFKGYNCLKLNNINGKGPMEEEGSAFSVLEAWGRP